MNSALKSDRNLTHVRSSVEFTKFEKCYEMIANLKDKISFQNEENLLLDDALLEYKEQLKSFKISIKDLESQIDYLENDNHELIRNLDIEVQTRNLIEKKNNELESEIEIIYFENRNLKEELLSISEALTTTQDLNQELKLEIENLKIKIDKLSLEKKKQFSNSICINTTKSKEFGFEEKLKSIKKLFDEKDSKAINNKPNEPSKTENQEQIHLRLTTESLKNFSDQNYENLVSFAPNILNQRILELESENAKLNEKLGYYKEEINNIQESMNIFMISKESEGIISNNTAKIEENDNSIQKKDYKVETPEKKYEMDFKSATKSNYDSTPYQNNLNFQYSQNASINTPYHRYSFKSALKESQNQNNVSPIEIGRTATISSILKNPKKYHKKNEEKYSEESEISNANEKCRSKFPSLIGAKSPHRSSPFSYKSVRKRSSSQENSVSAGYFRKLENVHETFKLKIERYSKRSEYHLSKVSRLI